MARPAPDRLRIVSYNILDGGEGRIDAIAETLSDLDGDLVGICEAHDRDATAYLARKLRYTHLHTESNDGINHVALLTREPVERMVNLAMQVRALTRGAMEMVTTLGDGRVRFVLCHLHAGQNAEDEPTRLKELTALLDLLNEEPMPTMLLGDLNAAAPYHRFDYHAASPKIHQRLERRGAHQLDQDVIRRLLDAGWTDTYFHARPGEQTHTFTTGYPATRFDYIWVTRELRAAIADAGVETGGFTPYCSDHYPIWAELRRSG